MCHNVFLKLEMLPLAYLLLCGYQFFFVWKVQRSSSNTMSNFWIPVSPSTLALFSWLPFFFLCGGGGRGESIRSAACKLFSLSFKGKVWKLYLSRKVILLNMDRDWQGVALLQIQLALCTSSDSCCVHSGFVMYSRCFSIIRGLREKPQTLSTPPSIICCWGVINMENCMGFVFFPLPLPHKLDNLHKKNMIFFFLFRINKWK